MHIPDAALKQHIAIKRKRLPIPAPKTCVRCGATFQPTAKYPQQRFCSCKCGLKATLPPDHNSRVAKASAAKRGDALRGRGEGRTYTKMLGRHEHRVVAELKIGRPLQPGEVVHHRDGNHKNNHPDNLEVLPSQAEHTRIHMAGTKQSAEHIAKRVASRKNGRSG